MIKIKNLHLKYWDVNNLHGWAMVNEDFIKSYYEKYDEGCFFEGDVKYSKKLPELHNDLPILPK